MPNVNRNLSHDLRMPEASFLPYLLLVLTVLFWSGNFVLGRAVHGDIPPVALAFWRWLVALFILSPFAVRPLLSEWRIISAHMRLMTLLAILSVTNFNTFIYMALQTSTVVNTVLVNSSTPIWIVCISRVLFGEQLTLRKVCGVLLSLFGLIWVVTRGQPAVLLAIEFSRGDLWTLAAALSWAVYTVLLRKRPPELSQVGFLSSIILIGLLFLSPFYFWEIKSGAFIVFSTSTVISVGYVALFPSVLAYIFWNRSVRMVGASKAGIFMHLMPAFSILLAVFFLNEKLYLFHVVGIALIFTGILLTTLEKRPAGSSRQN